MDIAIGSRMIAEFPGKKRMSCNFIGLAHDEFIVVRVPMTTGIRERMAEGAVLQLRYLKGGKIVSFECEVMHFQATPASIAFVSYPLTFSEHNLRKEARVQCRFPTRLTVASTECTGYIVDISPNGCRFIFEGSVAPEMGEQETVSGSFETMANDRQYAFNGTVMMQRFSSSEKALGIKFEGDVELPDGVVEQLDRIDQGNGPTNATTV